MTKRQRELIRATRALAAAKKAHRSTKLLQKDVYRRMGSVLAEEVGRKLPLLERVA